MLAVAAFVAFWVIVALGLVAIASRAGGRRPSRGLTRAASRSAITLFVVTAAVFGIALPILMLVGNHTNASAQVGGIKLTSGEKAGRELFGQHCGVCHTLAAVATRWRRPTPWARWGRTLTCSGRRPASSCTQSRTAACPTRAPTARRR